MNDSSDIRQSSISSAEPKKTVSVSYNSKSLVKGLVILVVIVLAFLLGLYIGRHHSNQTTTANTAPSYINGSGGGGYGFRHSGGSFGTVSAISSSSITINNSRTGSSETYTITSSTKITSNGTAVSTSSITDGETVIVIPSTSDSSDAASIIVNPSFGGPSTNSSGSSTSTSGSSTNSSTAQ